MLEKAILSFLSVFNGKSRNRGLSGDLLSVLMVIFACLQALPADVSFVSFILLFIFRWGFTPYDDAKRFGHAEVADVLQTCISEQSGKETFDLNRQMKNLSTD